LISGGSESRGGVAPDDDIELASSTADLDAQLSGVEEAVYAHQVAAKVHALGDFLRARREQLRPADVGLVAGARRRVAGLRREELALLAGISVDYYLRLEQGRDHNPSAQVLDALAQALRLDVKATEYLHQLANPSSVRRHDKEIEAPAEGTSELLRQFPMAAIVANRCLDVLAANAVAQALSPGFAPGENFLRWRLLEPAARELYVDWDEATDVAVSGLREAAGSDPDDPRLLSLIDELSAASGRFRELWSRAEVGYRIGVIHLRHPLVGDLHLQRNRLNIPHSGGQHMLLYSAVPGSASATALEVLRAAGS
jgi:transcriptional regulator with XRE-family HTH domain